MVAALISMELVLHVVPLVAVFASVSTCDGVHVSVVACSFFCGCILGYVAI